MLPSDMKLNIKSGTVGYNNKILVSDGTFSLGKNDKVNTLELAKEGDKPKINYKVVIQPTITHKNSEQKHTHTKRKKLLWYSYSLEALLCALCFYKQVITTSHIGFRVSQQPYNLF